MLLLFNFFPIHLVQHIRLWLHVHLFFHLFIFIISLHSNWLNLLMWQESKSWYSRISWLLRPCCRFGIRHNSVEKSIWNIWIHHSTTGAQSWKSTSDLQETLYHVHTSKKATRFRCMPLSPRYDKPKILATKWQMDISEDGYWKPRASNTSALSSPKISKAIAACKLHQTT